MDKKRDDPVRDRPLSKNTLQPIVYDNACLISCSIRKHPYDELLSG